MLHMMLPLDKHFDSGFGAVADSFKSAADALEDAIEKPSLNPHLPVSFLYRHAIELYLKSGIITLHRKFNIPYGDITSTGEPCVPVKGKWCKIHTVHSLQPLYAHLRSTLDSLNDTLSPIPNTDWTFPPDLDQWIIAIEETDSSSTFFRYPVTKDKKKDQEKSTIHREDVDQMLSKMHGNGPRVKALLMLDGNDNIVEAFSHDDTRAKEIVGTLRQTAELFYCLRAMMSFVLTGGR